METHTDIVTGDLQAGLPAVESSLLQVLDVYARTSRRAARRQRGSDWGSCLAKTTPSCPEASRREGQPIVEWRISKRTSLTAESGYVMLLDKSFFSLS